ncbi:MAG: hypothetical protein MJA31_18785, partial [Clostridia bacterium]|nr:hypothetical protein [Clostridia bacterium]
LKYKIDNEFGVVEKTDIFDEVIEDSIINNVIGYIKDKSDLNREKQIRNNFAHFHYLRNDKAANNTHFFEQLNGLRNLLRVDRKLKNAVTKVVINVFDKHGFELTFTLDNHMIVDYDLKRKPLTDTCLDMDTFDEIKQQLEYKDYFLEMIKAIIFERDNV